MVTLNPSSAEIAFLVEAGLVYCQAKKFEEAREVFLGLRALQPANELAEIGLGSTDFAEGRFEDAVSHYRAALRLNSRSAYAHALLGEALLFCEERESARASLGTALLLDPRGKYGALARSIVEFMDTIFMGSDS